MAAKFKYIGDSRTVEDVARRSKRGGGYDSYIKSDVQMFKAREGECVIRILPAGWGNDPKLKDKWGDDWCITIWVHFGVGPDNATYLCLDKMGQGTCPVCEARNETEDEEERGQMRPNDRFLCWVVDRDNEKAGPQPWAMPKGLNQDINAFSFDKKKNSVVKIDRPDDGYDIEFNRQGTDQRTKYSGVMIARQDSPLHDDEKKQDKWLEYIAEHPLPDLLVYHEAEYIEKVLFGKISKKAAAEEEETPRRGRVKEEPAEEEEAPRGRRRRAEPEPEEDDRPPVRAGGKRHPPPEEEEAPTTRRRRAEPEPEPEEEEAPRSRRRRAEPEPDTEEDPPPRSRRRAEPEPEPEEDEPAPRARRGRAEPEEEEPAPRSRRRGRELDDEIPSEGEEETASSRSSSRRRLQSHDDEDDVDTETGELSKKESPTAQAKKKLERLKSRSR